MKRILVIIGTRPEAIKLAPVLRAMKRSERIEAEVCLSGQHTDLLAPFLKELEIEPYHRLQKVERGELGVMAASLLKDFSRLLAELKPDLVIVQGDTTTTLMGALAAFYLHIPIAHVEAGLRTDDLFSPWPEEGNRRMVGQLATFHFAPTEKALADLVLEEVESDSVWNVGNTGVEAVTRPECAAKSQSILVTVHRRENLGRAIRDICLGFKKVADTFPEWTVDFFVHPTPIVREVAEELFFEVDNIHLYQPVEHGEFLRHMNRCLFVATDSGGVQEEAPLLGKPLLILRGTTERPEGVAAGTARLIGTKAEDIYAHCKELIKDESIRNAMSRVHSPYGDGQASERIAEILEEQLV